MPTRKLQRLKRYDRLPELEPAYDAAELLLLKAVCLRDGDEDGALAFLTDTALRLRLAAMVNAEQRQRALAAGQPLPSPFLGDSVGDEALRLVMAWYGEDDVAENGAPFLVQPTS